MRLAFIIFKYFPHGGVARDLRKIAAHCHSRGHGVRIYALEWQGEPPGGAEVLRLGGWGLRSHVRQRRFAGRVAKHLSASPVDVVVGMNKLPGLDVYYAGDSCFEDKARTQRPWIYRLTPRYRHYARFERAVFGVSEDVCILAISPPQTVRYQAVYGTPAHRFHALPPGIERDRAAPSTELRKATREKLRVGEQAQVLLFLGSGFVKKGLDRVLRAMAALPAEQADNVRLLVAGDDKPGRFKRLAKRLGIGGKVTFLGGRDDVPALLAAADASVLPAYDENTGTAILESAIAGTPVLATANCGYAAYIERAQAGIVTPVPFEQERLNADLARLLGSTERDAWACGGRRLGEDPTIYAMVPEAVAALEAVGRGQAPPLVVFCVFRFTPVDPNVRALLPTADACRDRGMAVRIYAYAWQAPPPVGVELVRVPVAGMTKAVRLARWQRWVAADIARLRPDCVLGFEPAPASDIYLGSIACRRMDGLPPGMTAGPLRIPPGESVRGSLGLSPEHVVFSMASGDLVDAGFERLLVALGRLPEHVRSRARVLALGSLSARFHAIARSLGLREQVLVKDGPVMAEEAIAAADVFVDLAYRPRSNGWLFDALAAGRAVLASAAVVESALVREADAGIVLGAPFRQADCMRAAHELIEQAEQPQRWGKNGARFGADPCRHGAARRIADHIEARYAQRSDRRRTNAAVSA